MKIVPRMLLWIYALGVAVVSGFALYLYGVAPMFYSNVNRAIEIDDTVASGALLFLLVSLFFLVYRTKQRRREPLAVTQKMEHGDVKITYDTLEQLAERAASKIRGVQDLNARVRMMENRTVRIGVRFAVEADMDIPKITADLQEAVKTYVESTTGITVEQVTVYVTQLAVAKDVAKKRVE